MNRRNAIQSFSAMLVALIAGIKFVEPKNTLKSASLVMFDEAGIHKYPLTPEMAHRYVPPGHLLDKCYDEIDWAGLSDPEFKRYAETIKCSC